MFVQHQAIAWCTQLIEVYYFNYDDDDDDDDIDDDDDDDYYDNDDDDDDDDDDDNYDDWFKRLRPVLEGFVVTMHEGVCETGSQIPRALARGIWRTVCTSPSALWQQTRQIGLNHDYNMTFSIAPHTHECQYSPLKIRTSCSKWEPFCELLPLLLHVVPLNDGNCRLTIPVIKGRCARDALPQAFHIAMF